MEKRNVILVTDGDSVAQSAVERATYNIGGRCISASGGNPTVLSGPQIVEAIRKAEHDPVVVMVDDKGAVGKGKGEKAMEYILDDETVNVLGVIAVSSNGKDCNKLKVTASVTKDGVITAGAVDKYGNDVGRHRICGDTLSVLEGRDDLVIIGLGDPGKMDFNDEILKGAPITTMALREVLKKKHKN
jgi:stage V sporulation protein AE